MTGNAFAVPQSACGRPLEVLRACRLGLGGIVQLWCRGAGLREALAPILQTRSGRALPPGEEDEIQYAVLAGSDGPVDEILLAWTAGGAELNCHGGTGSALAVLRLLGRQGFVERNEAEWFGASCQTLSDEVRPLYSRAQTPLQVRWLAGVDAFECEAEAARDALHAGRTADELLPQVAGWVENGAISEIVFQRHTVALAGAPNTGKSTLFNALLLQDRAMVSPRAGTTRDAVSHPARFADLEVELLDTAGLLSNASGADEEAVRRSRKVLAEADLRILLLDPTRPLSDEDRDAWEAVSGRPTLIVLNKADAPGMWGEEALSEWGLIDSPLSLSAEMPQTLPPLTDRLGKALWGAVSCGEASPEAGPVTPRQRACCRELLDALTAQDVEQALTVLNRLLQPAEDRTESARMQNHLDGHSKKGIRREGD